MPGGGREAIRMEWRRWELAGRTNQTGKRNNKERKKKKKRKEWTWMKRREEEERKRGKEEMRLS